MAPGASAPGNQITPGVLAPENQIDLGGADKIVLGQALDAVGREGDAAVVVADFEVRMVVLDVGYMCERVHEAHRAIEVFERELAADGAGILRQSPSGIEVGEQGSGRGVCQRRRAAFTGFALFLSEIAHAPTAAWGAVLCESLRAKLRATYFSTRS